MRDPKSMVVLALFSVAGGCQGEIGPRPARPGSGETPQETADPDPDGSGPDDGSGTVSGCFGKRETFVKYAWGPVLSKNCIGCHSQNGLAQDTGFVLHHPAHPGHIDHNLALVESYARTQVDGRSLLLLKPTGQVEHFGGRVLDPDGRAARSLRTFVDRVDELETCPPREDYFAGVRMLDAPSLLRKAAIGLAGRLPTAAERARVREDPAALDGVLMEVMEDDGFVARVREFFNRRLGKDGLCQGLAMVKRQEKLGYTREQLRWWESRDVDEDTKRTWARRTNRGICRDNVGLIGWIVENDRPFTEIMTADHTAVNPYSARLFGVFDDIAFDDPWDPGEFRPARLHTGDGEPIPHAGILTSHNLLAVIKTNRSNKHRTRAAWFLDFFLDSDPLRLAPEDNVNALAVEADNPWMNDKNCAVCHSHVDPVAGAFTGYHRKHGHLRDGGIHNWAKGYWGEKTFERHWNGERMPDGMEQGAGLQWLGAVAAEDRRFAMAAVRHAFHMVTGRRPMHVPTDTGADDYDARLEAFLVQQDRLEDVVRRFTDSGGNFKVAVRDIVKSPYFRAAGLHPDAPATPAYGLATARLLTPSELDRKIESIFGMPWTEDGKRPLRGELEAAFGGIRPRGPKQGLEEPNAVWAGAARTLGTSLACRATPVDFERPADARLLFPHVEPATRPDGGAAAAARIRRNIRHLHRRILGRGLSRDHPEVDRIYDLFERIWRDGMRKLRDDAVRQWLLPPCRGERIEEDPHYTLRSWRAVLAYLMADYDFFHN